MIKIYGDRGEKGEENGEKRRKKQKEMGEKVMAARVRERDFYKNLVTLPYRHRVAFHVVETQFWDS